MEQKMLLQKQAILKRFYLGEPPDALPTSNTTDYFNIYRRFLKAEMNEDLKEEARSFLKKQLGIVETLPDSLPKNIDDLPDWIHQKTLGTGRQYQEYLQHRKAGSPRFYFKNKAQALLFLQQIEPTKSVDGAWLYAAIHEWKEQHYYPLIQIYLEELGYGTSAQNHVVLYHKLLQKEGIRTVSLPDHYYYQGCIQLALSIVGHEFLPELIGFNFGYEQTPLHLLISTYELDELGIDPYYFSLHVTIDNADTGHSKQAMNAVYSFMPLLSGKQDFYRRLKNGAKLNDLGMGSNDIISSLDLNKAVTEIFKQKAFIGQFSHGDYCKVQGKTMNEWLSCTDDIQPFITALEAIKWIKPNQDPQDSRFWQLISGDKAIMKGVFNQAELQIIYDWIAGEWKTEAIPGRRYRVQKPVLRLIEQAVDVFKSADIEELESQLDSQKSVDAKMALLIPYLSPALHSTDVGLWATQQYTALFNPALLQN